MGWFGGGRKKGASPRRKPRSERLKSAMPAQLPRAAAVAVARKVKAERKPLPWRQFALRAMPVVAVALSAGLLLAGWKMLDYVGSVPVSRVMVSGNLQHLDRRLLVERVQPLLAGAGFMTVDLEGIRSALLELPWVDKVSIQRRWPDQLVVAVSEQEAIARWGSDGLLNRRGEVFRPQPLGVTSDLPVLFGPDNLSAEVVARYAELRELLAEQKSGHR
jgi:cell division septal protein FtsQ